jgi:transcription initiation factor TFIIIB Brf1 subunit/transcription initiation factor TFIIB
VLGERAVDSGAEWRSFADEQGTSGSGPSRVSRVDERLPSGGLGSDITTGGQPPYNGGERGGGRLAQLHARSRLSQADRQVASGYGVLGQLADLLDLPQNIRVTIPGTIHHLSNI